MRAARDVLPDEVKKQLAAGARADVVSGPDGYSALGFVLLNGELDARGAAAAYQRSFELGYGDSDILAGDQIDRTELTDFNEKLLAEGKKPIQGVPVVNPA